MKARLAALWSAVGLPLFLALALAAVMGIAASRKARSAPFVAGSEFHIPQCAWLVPAKPENDHLFRGQT